MAKKRLPLSNMEEKIWTYILGYASDNGFTPTLTEIAAGINNTTKYARQSVSQSLANMERKGYIKRGVGWRNIRVITT